MFKKEISWIPNSSFIIWYIPITTTPVRNCPLQNKHYWNEGSLTGEKIPKWGTIYPCYSRDCKTAKCQSWRSEKEFCCSALFTLLECGPGFGSQIFFLYLQLWPLLAWQPLEPKGYKIHHIKASWRTTLIYLKKAVWLHL